MDLTQTRSKIQDVLFDTNRGLPYVHSRQIQDFLDRVETKFNILINDPHWDTVKLFVSKYPDICISKDIFLDLLNDLLLLDFVKYVHDKSDTRTFEVPSSLGSPLAIPAKSENIFTDLEFEQLNKHIDDNIEMLAKKSRSERVPIIGTGLAPGLRPPPTTVPSFNNNSRQTTTQPDEKKGIIQIRLADVFVRMLRKFESLLPYVNMILLVFLIVLLLGQCISWKDHIVPLLRKLLFYDTTKGLYWWQKWSITEELMWRFFMDME